MYDCVPARVYSQPFPSPQRVEDGEDEIEVVEDGQVDEQPVEDAVERLGEEDGHGEAVAADPDEADDHLRHALRPPLDHGELLQLLVRRAGALERRLPGRWRRSGRR